MRLLLLCIPLLAGCGDTDSTDYTPEVRLRAAAELHCPDDSLKVTKVPDQHGVHTFVVDGCGCTATYLCAYRDHDGCTREPTLEAAGASCH